MKFITVMAPKPSHIAVSLTVSKNGRKIKQKLSSSSTKHFVMVLPQGVRGLNYEDVTTNLRANKAIQPYPNVNRDLKCQVPTRL